MKCRYVGIVSDSHGRLLNVKQMVDAAPDVTAWIHAGDYCEDGNDLAAYAGVPVYVVRGNNDFRSRNVPDCRSITIDGITITVVHGHQWYGDRLEKLAELGKKNKASLVVFGHTHRRLLKHVPGITIVNPGSISMPRDCQTGTYAICRIANGILDDIQLYKL